MTRTEFLAMPLSARLGCAIDAITNAPTIGTGDLFEEAFVEDREVEVITGPCCGLGIILDHCITPVKDKTFPELSRELDCLQPSYDLIYDAVCEYLGTDPRSVGEWYHMNDSAPDEVTRRGRWLDRLGEAQRDALRVEAAASKPA